MIINYLNRTDEYLFCMCGLDINLKNSMRDRKVICPICGTEHEIRYKDEGFNEIMDEIVKKVEWKHTKLQDIVDIVCCKLGTKEDDVLEKIIDALNERYCRFYDTDEGLYVYRC